MFILVLHFRTHLHVDLENHKIELDLTVKNRDLLSIGLRKENQLNIKNHIGLTGPTHYNIYSDKYYFKQLMRYLSKII